MAETLAILTILTLAAAYVGHKLWRAATGKEAGCPGCSLTGRRRCGACPGGADVGLDTAAPAAMSRSTRDTE